jgi:hypothetical protein
MYPWEYTITNKAMVVTSDNITAPNGSTTYPMGNVKSPALAQMKRCSTGGEPASWLAKMA